MEPRRRSTRSPAWPERGISILNGVVGDYLERRGNGLAIAMTFVQHARPIAMTAHSIATAQPGITGRIAILVHGWCCNETIWNFPEDGTTYATKLQDEAGFTPFAVRFNSGLPLAQNGHDLAQLLRALVAAYPVPVDEIVLLGHSMGGLVIRAACHAGTVDNDAWVGRVTRILYLGTPHDGADLERIAHGATVALATIPNPVTRLIGNVLNIRSRGVKDLHAGGPLAGGADGATDPMRVPWLASAQHYRLVGTLTANPQNPVSRALGDGLVRVPSGVDNATAASGGNLLVFPGVHHLQLAHDAGVYTAILDICRDR